MKPVSITLVLFSALTLSSCTTVYTPTEVNVPMFKEINEFAAGATYGTSGAGLQLGYSITNNIAIIGSGSWMNVRDDNGRDYQRYGELGAGYFRSLGKKNSSGVEIYLGTGFGESSSYDNDFNAEEKGKYYKIFLQPDVSYSIGWIDISIAMRIVFLKYTSYSYLPTTENSPYLPSAFGFEPAFTFRLGPPNFKFKYQAGFSALTENEDKPFGRSGAIASLGLMLLF